MKDPSIRQTDWFSSGSQYLHCLSWGSFCCWQTASKPSRKEQLAVVVLPVVIPWRSRAQPIPGTVRLGAEFKDVPTQAGIRAPSRADYVRSLSISAGGFNFDPNDRSPGPIGVEQHCTNTSARYEDTCRTSAGSNRGGNKKYIVVCK
ncbi:hypothetical protein ZHAS_00016350 [Anopheles sinensis]|uniref:Uncharacterized protein n=1 Tax=Anopheles sinensis TaxID=74873 RepID=A0A084WDD6_ANOSI|nr:hypothetical protein ZHAS_00016350 [Anopheles sinensis]